MERNLSFETAGLNAVVVHLAWGQLEIFADDVEKIQVMAAGDDASVNDLRIEVREAELLVEQPQYGLSLNIMESRWLQVCVRMPRKLNGRIRANTISGMLSARKLGADEISLETVSGELRALKLTGKTLTLKTVSGDARAEELSADHIVIRSVSGDIVLDDLNAKTIKCNSVSGDQTYNMVTGFETIDITAVSGDVIITSPLEEVNASLRSLTGGVRTEGVNITENKDVPTVRVTGVASDLKLISIKE